MSQRGAVGVLSALCPLLLAVLVPVESSLKTSMGVMVPLRWDGPDSRMEPWAVRHAASAAMAVHHVNHRAAELVPNAESLLPEHFIMTMDLADSEAQASAAVSHAVRWNNEGVHAIVGSFRSAVTGPLALVASIEQTPVISFGATASSLSDRNTYPGLSRSVLSDAVLADSTIRSISSMGWTRVAMLYVNDAWGRSFSQDAAISARAVGVDIAVAVPFELGDLASIEGAVSQVARSETRITLCLVFDSDVEAVAASADSHGLLERGRAWILPISVSFADIVATSVDPQRTQSRLSGWLVPSLDLLFGEAGARFRDVFEGEPLEHLNRSVLTGQVTEEIIGGACDEMCGTIYDAVWTAAIAVGRVGLAEDGAVDKAALLTAIRNVSFEGATGRVQYDRVTGERDASDHPLIMKNLRPVTNEDGKASLSLVATWRWQGGRLERESAEAPVWPGGEQGWVLPHEELECGDGYVFSTSSLQCEACPEGTDKQGNECVRFDARLGVMVPLRWGGESFPVDAWGCSVFRSALMAVQHINSRSMTLLPHLEKLIPTNFTVTLDYRDSYALPEGAVEEAVRWNEDERHVIVGSYRSAVTGPLSLVASIEQTPVISWGATASSLSDRNTYPTLSRTVLSDAVLADSTIRSISSMGWTRVAMLYVNDAWGRGFSAEVTANVVGVGVIVAAEFELGDTEAMEEGIRAIAASGAKIILCVAFASDIAAIADAAEKHGLLQSGHVWMAPEEQLTVDVVDRSDNPDTLRRQLAGWLTVSVDTMHGPLATRFHAALDQEPAGLPNSVPAFSGISLDTECRQCNQFCGIIYDAVWTAAIAVGRVGLAEDGAVDKAALLTAIRNVSFEGATGRVQYDRVTGERDASDHPLIMKNLRPVTNEDGKASLSLVATWRWQGGRLERESAEAPVWPGGEQGWVLPHEELECGDGYVFSTSSLQCEACPKGTDKQGNECVRFDARLGVMVPLRWGGVESAMEPWAVRYGASALMAVQHINSRSTTLVPHAQELIPAGFRLVLELSDSEAQASVAVSHAVRWNDEGRHVMIGSYRSAVTGPLALAASIEQTPVITWASTASSLSDRNTYPGLSRSVLSDAVLADSTIRSISSMGWTRVAMLYVNDAWGRGFSQDAATAASRVGVDIAVAVPFELGDLASIEGAVSQVARSETRITLCLVFDSDVEAVAASADSHGLLEGGRAWIVPTSVLLDDVLAASVDPQRTQSRLSGWLVLSLDLLFGEAGARFRDVFEGEALEHLNRSVLTGQVTEEIIGGACDQYCGTIYDTIWAAAIAVGRVGVAEDGAVDKAALLTAIRNVSFEGATGRVQYDRVTGERDASDHPLIMKNLRPVTNEDGKASLSLVATWRWQGGRLERESAEAPVWPGGEQGWVLPHEELECGDGYVFSTSSLQCEACPKGTEKERNECVRFDARLGVMVPLCTTCPNTPFGSAFVRYGASALMAVQHINSRSTTLVPNAMELIPAGFKLFVEVADTEGDPPAAVSHAVTWNKEGRHAIVGSYRSAVTGPLGLVASIEQTPVIAWGAAASSLANRVLYPTVSRVVLNDAALAKALVKAFASMGWMRIAVLYVNDAWGRGLWQDFAREAQDIGLRIETSVQFAFGDKADIENAVRVLAEAGTRITLCATFDSDLATIAVAAQAQGLLAPGHVWLVPYDVAADLPVSAEAQQLLQGWMTASLDLFRGKWGSAFQDALESEPLEHLNRSVLTGQVTEDILGGNCDQLCGTIYDAVWTAAVAVGRVGVAEDGSVDKEALLIAIRNVSFEGATGMVQYDSVGERDASEKSLYIKNYRWDARRAGTLAPVVTWQWSPDAFGGPGLLAQVGSEGPLWPGGDTSWTPPTDGFSCDLGSVFVAETRECEKCPLGSFYSDQTCLECPLGAFSAEQGVVQCSRCQVGFANETGMSHCHPCPANTARRAASAGESVTECLCEIGFYSLEGPGHDCFPCVVGGDCDGGDAVPYPMEGFWGDARCEVFGGNQSCESWGFLECEPDNCKGGQQFECFEGRRGRLCQDAEDGWFTMGGTFYVKCGEFGWLINIFAIVLVVTCWSAIELVAGEKCEAVAAMLLFIQIASIIGEYSLKWHQYLSLLNLGFAVADFDVDFVEPLCLAEWSSARSFYLQLCVPFIFNLTYVIIGLLQMMLSKHKAAPSTFRAVLDSGIQHQVVVLIIVYHTQCIKCFETFLCTTFPDGKSYMASAVDVQCWNAEHYGMVVTASVYIPLLVAFPVWVWWHVSRHHNAGTLHHSAQMKQWGFLHSMFESDYKWWTAMLLVRRFAIALTSVLAISELIKASITIVVLTFLLALHTYAKPFVSATVDILDFVCLCLLIFYTMAGMLMFPTVTAEAQGLVCTDETVGLEAEWCEGELAVKRHVAIVACVGVGLLLAFALKLTHTFVTETRDGHRAYRRMVQLLRREVIEGDADVAVDLRPPETANKIGLDQTINGTLLRRWIMSVEEGMNEAGSLEIASSAESFMVLARKMQTLAEDVSDFSNRPIARLMRHLCRYPGLLEMLLWKGGDALPGLLRFIEAMAEFEQAAWAGRGRWGFPPQSPYNITDRVVKFEHRPFLAIFLLTATDVERHHLAHLFDAILAANHLSPDPALRRISEHEQGPPPSQSASQSVTSSISPVWISFRSRLRSARTPFLASPAGAGVRGTTVQNAGAGSGAAGGEGGHAITRMGQHLEHMLRLPAANHHSSAHLTPSHDKDAGSPVRVVGSAHPTKDDFPALDVLFTRVASNGSAVLAPAQASPSVQGDTGRQDGGGGVCVRRDSVSALCSMPPSAQVSASIGFADVKPAHEGLPSSKHSLQLHSPNQHNREHRDTARTSARQHTTKDDFPALDALLTQVASNDSLEQDRRTARLPEQTSTRVQSSVGGVSLVSDDSVPTVLSI